MSGTKVGGSGYGSCGNADPFFNATFFAGHDLQYDAIITARGGRFRDSGTAMADGQDFADSTGAIFRGFRETFDT